MANQVYFSKRTIPLFCQNLGVLGIRCDSEITPLTLEQPSVLAMHNIWPRHQHLPKIEQPALYHLLA
jgi:hypothetical protein